MSHSDSGACRTLIPEHVAHFSVDGGERKALVNPKIWHAIPLRNKEVVMAQERLTVKKIKEIMRLKYEAKLSNRVVAGACKVSNSTVGEYLKRAETAGISWPPGEIGEEELYQKLFPEKKAAASERKYPMPDWEEAQKEKRQKGVTLQLLWQEYKEKYPEG